MNGFENGNNSNEIQTNTIPIVYNNEPRLEVEDALSYLDRVKNTFKDNPEVYTEFLNTIKQFRSNIIDTPGVMEKVCYLFKDQPYLFDGFNAFLPDGFKIGVENNPNGCGYQVLIHLPASIVFQNEHEITPQIETVQSNEHEIIPQIETVQSNEHEMTPQIETVQSNEHEITPQIETVQSNDHDYSLDEGIFIDNSGDVIYEQQQHFIQNKQPSQPVEFIEAMDYVNKIKGHFEKEPGKYKKFLSILHQYEQQQKNEELADNYLSIYEVYNKVAELFEPGDELLKEFGKFFPD